MGVVSRRWMWMESMSVASGCGCKEVHRFPHNYLSLLLLYLFFFAATFCSFFNVFRSLFNNIIRT